MGWFGKTVESLIKCRYCNGELELNTLNQYVNIMGSQICSYAPISSTTASHLPQPKKLI